MGYLRNPFGRLVAVDDPKQYDALLKTPGFSKPTHQEEKEHILSRMAQAEGMKADERSKGVYFTSVSQGNGDGYSISSGQVVKELQKLGIKVSSYYTGQKIALLMHNPYSILRIEAPYRVIYTMFESDKIPADWYDYLKACDKVLVPSKWCQGVFLKANIEADVLPLGYNDEVFTYFERPEKTKQRRNFVFLHYNAFNIRKGFPEVFKAFNKAFAKDEPVKLVLKTHLHQIPLPITKQEYPNIEIVNEEYNESQMFELLKRSDCFVFPSRGEGFGIPPLEAMATGMPAIVPNAHGISEYFNPDYMLEVKVAGFCPGLYSRYKNQDVGRMVVCDSDDLAKQMRWVYDHQQEAKMIGRRAAQYVKQWTFKKTAEKLKDLFFEIMIKPLPPRQMTNVLTLEMVK